MFGSTLVAEIAVIGIPITMDTMASANWRARPLCSAACARLASWACRISSAVRASARSSTRSARLAATDSAYSGPEFHPRCESCLGIALQFFARLARNGPVVRWHRVRGRRIHLVGLKILGWEIPGWRLLRIVLRLVLLRIVLGRVVLRRVVLRRIVLGWIVLRRRSLPRTGLRDRPLGRWLGHVDRIVRLGFRSLIR